MVTSIIWRPSYASCLRISVRSSCKHVDYREMSALTLEKILFMMSKFLKQSNLLKNLINMLAIQFMLFELIFLIRSG